MGEGVKQWLEPEAGAVVDVAEDVGEAVGEDAAGAAVLVVEPVLVAALAADRSGRCAGAWGTDRLWLAEVGQHATVLTAAGTGGLGAQEPPVAGGAGRPVGPDR